MVEFARALGTHQSAISRYEHGKQRPSRSTLILLLQLAENDAERAPILDALGVDRELRHGWPYGELERALADFEAYLRAGGRGLLRRRKSERLAEFARAARAIVQQDRSIPAGLVDVLHQWLRYGHLPDAGKFFDHIAIYLDVQLKTLGPDEGHGPER